MGMSRFFGTWLNAGSVNSVEYQCGYCNTVTAPSEGYNTVGGAIAVIFICPKCNRPTFIEQHSKLQVPGPIGGRNVKGAPESVSILYQEARKCISVHAYTAAVLCCRKILMNIAVAEGAPGNKNFHEYVTYLEDNHYVPPRGRSWVDEIRKKGNEANHEIPHMEESDALEILKLVEGLLIFIYELADPPTTSTSEN